jgi:hypothetical protein
MQSQYEYRLKKIFVPAHPDNSRVEVAGYARQRVFRYTKVCRMPDNAAEPVTSTRFM